MAEYRNRVGQAYGLTTFASIDPRFVDEVQAYIDGLPLGPESPLARLEQLHLSRIQIFRELVDQGGGHEVDVLEAPQLVFTSSFDGDLDRYLDAICDRVPEADTWWGHCTGYPGRSDKAAFRAWIRAHRLDAQLFASAYPDATVQDVRSALALRERIVAFAAETQGLDAAALQQRFLAELA
ncbi:hypothetical protein [Candidatus Solirubrobacter pratensis]|uniref:hypothetical protein n=1 Tax=Candidatus Solirubrobacter pratensis TaxID=1298857 RepID=UPI00040B868A|nr:hypothetical protein [Candidatus Solirubrobacter pratensis]